MSETDQKPAWIIKGKTIRGLIEELKTFEDQDLEVRISVDDGTTSRCISMVKKQNRLAGSFCLLVNCEDAI